MKKIRINMFGFAHHALLGLVVVTIIVATGVKVLTGTHALEVTSGGGTGYANGKLYYGGYMRNPDGSGLQKLSGLDTSSANLSNMSFDGTQVAYWGSNRAPAALFKGTVSNTSSIGNISTVASPPVGDGPIMPPAWSPDGRRVAETVYTPSGPKIWVANTDGSGSHFVPNVPNQIGSYIAWRPGSENIVYTPYVDASGSLPAKNSKICTISIGGVSYGCHAIPLGSVTPASALGEGGISVSPDGNNVALISANNFLSAHPASADIYVVNSKGLLLKRLTSSNKGEVVLSAVWSPDGTKIAYLLSAGNSSTPGATGLWTMNADGTGKKQISTYPTLGVDLAFQNTLSWAHK